MKLLPWLSEVLEAKFTSHTQLLEMGVKGLFKTDFQEEKKQNDTYSSGPQH